MIVKPISTELGIKIGKYENDKSSIHADISALSMKSWRLQALERSCGTKLKKYIIRLYLDHLGDLVGEDYDAKYRYKRWSERRYGSKDWYRVRIPSQPWNHYQFFRDAARTYYSSKRLLPDKEVITKPCANVCIKPFNDEFEYRDKIHTLDSVGAYIFYLSSNTPTEDDAYEYVMVIPTQLDAAIYSIFQL